ncbi:MAG: Zn-dependent hydrolase [Pseudonocardiales bacterium]|nr:MAG: Zn-dependent hydrolase [Pseudonocardiales bacterium]
MDIRRLPGLTIAKLAVGPMNNNAYLLRCTSTDEGLLIDAANEAARLRELVAFEGPAVSAILTTHRHGDHRQALAETVEFAGAALYAAADADELPVAALYRDPEGVPHLFTGDSLFPGDVGKTWAPEDFVSLIDDVEARIFGELPDETWFYPGHGSDSTLGVERPHVAEWRARGW